MVVGRPESSRASLISMFHVLVAATVNPAEGANETIRSPVLLSYVQYMYDNIPDARKFLFEELVRVYLVVLKERVWK